MKTRCRDAAPQQIFRAPNSVQPRLTLSRKGVIGVTPRPKCKVEPYRCTPPHPTLSPAGRGLFRGGVTRRRTGPAGGERR